MPSRGFFAELKRRHVYRAGVIYAMTAWVIIQAATQIFMANPKAQARDYMEGFGLTEHEFNLIVGFQLFDGERDSFGHSHHRVGSK